jgi:hypothetical protein
MRTVVMGVVAAVGVLGALGGCACQHCGNGEAAVVAEASGTEREAFEKLKSLAGTWEAQTPEGPGTSVFSVGSGGSSVREVMLPGTDHEMTNMYHLDGDTLVMTHYCAVGNQPRMRARGVTDPNVIDFKFDSVTNRTSKDQLYMGSMKLTIVDADHIKQEWTSYGGDHGPVAFELTRKK